MHHPMLLEKLKLLIARVLVVSLFAFCFPVLTSLSTAQAADVPAAQWVGISVKADPLMENLIIPADATTKGMWSTVKNWPVIGIHSVLLTDGKVLTYGTDLIGTENGRYFDIWDPTLGFATNSHLTTYRAQQQDSFCSTAIYLNNGSLLISGGNTGSSRSNTIFTPNNNSVSTSSNNLADDRWYATMINLPDGRPIIMGGMVPFAQQTMVENPSLALSQGLVSTTPEVYENGAWRTLIGAYSRDAFGPDYLRAAYPRAWVAPNGNIFGISAEKMWSLNPTANNGNGTIQTLGNFKQAYSATNPVNVGAIGTAVMYDIGKVIQVGGNGGYDLENIVGSDMATVVDINGTNPVLYEQPRMTFPRKFTNAIVLANGDVVVTGGSKLGNTNGANAVYTTEIWKPSDNNLGTWTLAANAAIYRGYHAFTTLMPNGTVLSTGGGAPGPVDNFNAEIYYPPYLFKNNNGSSQLATRPIIQGISGLSYMHGAQLQIDMATSDSISQVVLVGLTIGTHSLNQGQRRIPLAFSQDSIRLNTTIPNANLTPPGYYQVVVIDANGIPSLGTIIGIGQGLNAPSVTTVAYSPPDLTTSNGSGNNLLPSVSITSPVKNTIFDQGSNITINVFARDSDGSISIVEFYDGTTLLGLDTASPYSLTLTNAGIGTHNLIAKAYDNTGAVATSANLTINVKAPNIAPSVGLTSPTANTIFVQGDVINITASATDADGSVTKVEFYDGANLMATDVTAPYTAILNNAALGTHTLTAKAYDNSGAFTTSANMNINVIAPNVAPTISITSPIENASFIEGDPIIITANALDTDGSIAKVEFYDGATLLDTITTAPFTSSLNNATLGLHSLSAKAYDNIGAATMSVIVNISVKLANVLPTVNIISPTINSSVTQSNTINFNANAADIDGIITKVEFYDNEVLIGTATTSPYSVAFNSAVLGDHHLSAKAYDDTGGTTSSDVVNIAVIASIVQQVTKPTTPIILTNRPTNSIRCASQNGTCKIPGGATASIWYGAKTKWLIKTNASGNVVCKDVTFGGNPILKTAKSCFYSVTNTMQPATDAVLCATQSKVCKVPKGFTATVWYGAGNSWYNKITTKNVTCNSTSFGNPIAGTKSCVFVLK